MTAQMFARILRVPLKRPARPPVGPSPFATVPGRHAAPYAPENTDARHALMNGYGRHAATYAPEHPSQNGYTS